MRRQLPVLLLFILTTNVFSQVSQFTPWYLFDGGGNFSTSSGTIAENSIAPGFTGISNGGGLIAWSGLAGGIDNSITSAFSPTTETVPHHFELLQNYPNPFNPSTTIRFSLPEKSIVRLSIYDIIGREVQLLVDNEMSAGFHSVSFNATNFSSGLYFYRITAGQSYIAVRKMVVMK